MKEISKQDLPAVFSVPNFISLTRIFLAPYLAFSILHHAHSNALLALFVASVSDLADGYIARRTQQETYLGTLIDPLCDKIMIMTCAICMGLTGLIKRKMARLIPMILLPHLFIATTASIIVIRDILLISATIRHRLITLPSPQTFKQFFNPRVAPFQVKPSQLSRYYTVMQIAMLASSLTLHALCMSEAMVATAAAAAGMNTYVAKGSVCQMLDIFVAWMHSFVGVTTIASGLGYLMDKESHPLQPVTIASATQTIRTRQDLRKEE